MADAGRLLTLACKVCGGVNYRRGKEMTEQEIVINQATVLLPWAIQDDGETIAYPAIEIGGVQVYAYFDEGTLHVSVHYDTADPQVQAEDGEVPTEVSIGGETVYAA